MKVHDVDWSPRCIHVVPRQLCSRMLHQFQASTFPCSVSRGRRELPEEFHCGRYVRLNNGQWSGMRASSGFDDDHARRRRSFFVHPTTEVRVFVHGDHFTFDGCLSGTTSRCAWQRMQEEAGYGECGQNTQVSHGMEYTENHRTASLRGRELHVESKAVIGSGVRNRGH